MPLVDTQDTELARKAEENQLYVTLYDPPVDGKTPLDGMGDPMTSPIQLRDEKAKLAQGFTKEPLPAPKVVEPPKAKVSAKKR